MKVRLWRALAGAVVLLSATPVPVQADESPAPMRRFALVVGSNGGSAGQVRLKYAVSDARSFAEVLTELGGVGANDLALLVDPKVAALRDAMARMGKAIAAAKRDGAKSGFILYYSGHSDDEGLLLGGERLDYATLRRDLETVGADLRVAIVDSCSSGSLTRAKGGTARPAFLFDASSVTEGHAYLTASSPDESAQESDRVGGSFFTHYLVSGLRGAADFDGRGVVTLNEAYAFAFKETLASTEKTKYGPQHPAYEFNLTGSGDLIFTDLRSNDAGLSLAADLAGRMYIRDSRGQLAVELEKTAGKPMEIGLSPGRYDIVLDRSGSLSHCPVEILARTRTPVTAVRFAPVAADATTARGPAESSFALTWSVDFLPDFARGLFASDGDRSISLNLLAGAAGSLAGFEVAGLVNAESRHVSGFQAAGFGNLVAGDVSAFQTAGFGNYAGGDLVFAQSAGLVNILGGSARGAQIAGILNVAGLKASGQGESEDGVARFSVAGAQVAGLANVDFGGLAGAQVAGLLNLARAETRGAQVAGIANIAGDLAGAQVGLLNVARDITGTQIGLVNIARRIRGLPLGLVNYEEDGISALEAAWGGPGTPAELGFRLGTRFVYTRLGIAHVPEGPPGSWSTALAFGGRLPLGPFFLDLDAGAEETFDFAAKVVLPALPAPLLRLTVGLPVGTWALVGGAELAWDAASTTISTAGILSADKLSARFFGGIQI